MLELTKVIQSYRRAEVGGQMLEGIVWRAEFRGQSLEGIVWRADLGGLSLEGRV